MAGESAASPAVGTGRAQMNNEAHSPKILGQHVSFFWGSSTLTVCEAVGLRSAATAGELACGKRWNQKIQKAPRQPLKPE